MVSESYEVMFLFKPLTNEDINDKVFNRIEKVVKDNGGEITVRERIGKKMLAFDIGVFKEGFYLLCDMTLPSKNLAKTKKQMNSVNEVLRTLVISKKNL